MSNSYSFNQSFTLTNAKYLASKVAADLKRMQRFYGKPSDAWINSHELEIIVFLRHGYLKKVIYGFQRNGKWIEPTLIYTAQDLARMYSNDDDPGRIHPRAGITNESFTSFLIYSDSWRNVSNEEKAKFEASLPFQRGTGNEPEVDGYIENDRTYTSGGKSLNRSSVKKY